MVEVLGTIATALAIGGVILNNRKIIFCFYLWLVSNFITAMIHYNAGIFSLLIRDLIFLVLATEGIYRWRKKHNEKQG